MYELTVIFRIGLAIFLASILGVERELTGKFAGLRTHILVSLGACVFTILSLYAFQISTHAKGVIIQDDPARIAAQIITGIGFIGAGTVMRHGSSVSGITTAATLWVCAAIGMACGSGQYVIAVFSAVCAAIVLVLIRSLEKNVLAKRKVAYKNYDICLCAKLYTCDMVQGIFENNFHKIYKFTKSLTNHEDLCFSASISTKKSLSELNELFEKVDSISSIEIRESFD